MCGIAGILSRHEPVSKETLASLTDAVAHRGPNGRGIWIEGSIGLGHRRLSILDLSEQGRCPMSYTAPDGREYVITYNGEVYNFLELRIELSKEGYEFHTATDTEVVVAAYARWGEACLERFNGMWALAIWDKQKRSLFLVRDRFGIKPLYYLFHRSDLYFASELKAFRMISGFKRSLNEGYAREALHLSQPLEGTSDETLMNGVHRLMPGSLMEVVSGKPPRIRKWWETKEHYVDVPNSYREQVAGWRELFLDAIRLRLRSDVPVATSLSGGLDSSSVAGAVAHIGKSGSTDARRAPSWQQCFISTFPGTAIDERKYADEVVKWTGSVPNYSEFNSEEGIQGITESVWVMEDVYPAIATPVIENYRAMSRKGVVVSLDGHGGDELLGGYDWYLATPMKELNERLYQQFHSNLLPSILKNFDRCSMASGVEVRMPFMDWRLVCYTFSLPPETKIGGGYTKRILRDAMQGLVPEDILRRRSKIGFNSPMIEWFNAGLNGVVEKTINHPRWNESRLFDGKRLGTEILSKTKARSFRQSDWNKTLQYWGYLNLIIWEMLFLGDDEGLKKGYSA
jgi:asparagine synthase (glutamine-hydrolysing)